MHATCSDKEFIQFGTAWFQEKHVTGLQTSGYKSVHKLASSCVCAASLIVYVCCKKFGKRC